jgi:hypothetical protein
MNEIYYEKCINVTMPYYPFFIDKIKNIQNVSQKIYIEKNDDKYYPDNIPPKNNLQYTLCDYLNNTNNRKCKHCVIKIVYKLANIFWPDNIIHIIKHHKRYPSEYFIKVIINTSVYDEYIINPPIQLENDQISLFDYIPLHYNKLLILDALMHQGSCPRYLKPSNENEKYIFSEHSGVISISNKVVDSIVISTETNRIDKNDNNIYLPKNIQYFENHEYLFHTHPNTINYGGRINEGILYEFPSSNDILNFIKYHNQGRALSSLIIAPEGIYVIRLIRYQKIISYNLTFFHFFNNFLLRLEKMAIEHIKKYICIDKLSNPNIFHKYVSRNFKYIRIYNKFIEQINLFVEYYPRIEKNGEWRLQQIYLQYLDL